VHKKTFFSFSVPSHACLPIGSQIESLEDHNGHMSDRVDQDIKDIDALKAFCMVRGWSL
jgi:hypothetical protein